VVYLWERAVEAGYAALALPLVYPSHAGLLNRATLLKNEDKQHLTLSRDNRHVGTTGEVVASKSEVVITFGNGKFTRLSSQNGFQNADAKSINISGM
jgi:hypothetical protein